MPTLTTIWPGTWSAFRATPLSTRRGLELARKAVELAPNNWMFWNTLGVAAFRTGDWKTASESLHKSMSLTGGGAADWFFLAMTRWHQGEQKDARAWFDRAVAAVVKESPSEYMLHELLQFHAEAAALLGLPGPKLEIGQQAAGADRQRHPSERPEIARGESKAKG